MSMFGTPVFQWEAGETLQNVKKYEYLIDKERSLTIEDVIRVEGFERIESENPNFGISNAAVWLRFKVENLRSTTENKFLVLNNSSLDVVDYFLVVNDQVVDNQLTGRIIDFSTRILPSNKLIFSLRPPADEAVAYIYLRVQSSDKKIVSAFIASTLGVYQRLNFENVLFGIFTGVIVGLFFYNVFLYSSVRDITYLVYVLHLLAVWFAQSSILGYTQELLWPNWVWMNQRSIVIFSSLVSIVGIWFLKVFLNARHFVPTLNKGFYFIYFVYAFILANAFFISITLSYQVLLVTQSIVVMYVFLVAFRILKKGYGPARLYLIAWSVFMVGIFIFVFSEMGIIPFTKFSAYIMPFGSGLEVVLISFALADKINILKKEKESEQQEKLAFMKRNETLITRQNEFLEEKVKQRTIELEDTLHNLQSTQTQLVEQEKMASLGQLTAGIAHEINNPINFVSSNVSPLKRDIGDILEILRAYKEKGLHEFNQATLKELKSLEEELELDYLVEEIDQLLHGMEDGAKRTVEIVKGLKLFSRVDEQDVKKVNLHDGLDSTLILLSSSMNGKISVIKSYDTIPLVECLAGKINQVFMNILTNAIQALLENEQQKESPKITIRTKNLNNFVEIEIEDNGPGIPESIKQRIFEPFFTTKGVGKGTGLGLSIVYTIIENHKGFLEVNSVLTQGTIFKIRLPILQNTLAHDGNN
ncbi:sensor histidine kinase [Mongoliitalea daihaiensis]|nr:sensor histidine kinase [Mongoliitalea daihaiensis]